MATLKLPELEQKPLYLLLKQVVNCLIILFDFQIKYQNLNFINVILEALQQMHISNY